MKRKKHKDRRAGEDEAYVKSLVDAERAEALRQVRIATGVSLRFDLWYDCDQVEEASYRQEAAQERLGLVLSLERMHTLSGHGKEVTCVAIERDRDLIATGSRDETVKIWSIDSGSMLHSMKKEMGTVLCLRFVGGALAVGSSDGDIFLWDVDTGACVGILEGHRKKVLSLGVTEAQDLVSGTSCYYVFMLCTVIAL